MSADETSAGRGPSGRRVAAKVLHRVEVDGAWAGKTLDVELARGRLSPGEAGRAADLVYGSLRSLRTVDAAIDAQRTKKGDVESLARAVLRVAVFELLFTAAPAHAVVSEAVSLVKRERSEGLARFVNAVLRRIADKRDAAARPRTLDLPDWVMAELVRSVGQVRTTALLETAGEAPALGLRAYGIDRDVLVERIHGERSGAELSPSALTPRAILARRLGDPRTLGAYAAGQFAAQDVGSQRVAELVGAAPGQSVLDACAGRGGKTAVLADAVGATGRVVAVDLFERKLEEAQTELRRLGVRAAVQMHTLDLAVGTGPLTRTFDRALVDAPCTGLGTVRRRPEILNRVRPEDPQRMSELQLAIARNVAPLVRPGGLVAVATCSFAVAEGAELAGRIEQAVPGLTRVLDEATDADGLTRIGPWSDPARASDAYQLVRFRVA